MTAPTLTAEPALTGAVRPAAGLATSATEGLETARFIDLVTRRRTGVPIGTPVLFVQDGERLLVRTAHDAGKLKRLAHTAAVEIAACDSRGRRLGPAVVGRARILGPEEVARAVALLHAKYRIAGTLSGAIRHLRGKRDVIVEIVLDGSPAARPA